MTPVIQWDGKVTTCCYDPLMELEIGHINESSLTDIWYGKEMQKRRALQIAGDFTYPKKCYYCKNVDGIEITDDQIIKYLDDADRLDLLEKYLTRRQIKEEDLSDGSKTIIAKSRARYDITTLKEQARVILNNIPKSVCAGFWASPTINWNGEVTVCCKDGYLELSAGNITEKSFKELWWNNPLMIERRIQHIRGEGDQIPLCKECLFQSDLKTLQIKQNELKEYLHNFLNNKPFSPKSNFLTIELTNKCNMKCIMCPQAENNQWNSCRADPFFGFMTLEKFKLVLNNLKGEHFCDLVLFWFGEPLLNPELPEILRDLYEFNEKNFLYNNLVIHTNGLLLTKKIANLLLETKNKLIIHLSIDAATKETYNFIRKNSNFGRVMENIKYFLIEQKKNPNVMSALQFIVMEQNKNEAQQFLNNWRMFGKENQIDFKLATRNKWPEGNNLIFFRNLAAQSVIMIDNKMTIPDNNLELYDKTIKNIK